VKVPVTTLDSPIRQGGTPKFFKIDVEGFELRVLRGLTCTIPIISFEFSREGLDAARLCVDHILSLGTAQFNFSLYAQHTFYSLKWLDSKCLFNALESIPDEDLCEDVYVAMEYDYVASLLGSNPQVAREKRLKR
jgi:hypothetical protein